MTLAVRQCSPAFTYNSIICVTGFEGAREFNGDVSKWNVPEVGTMYSGKSPAMRFVLA